MSNCEDSSSDSDSDSHFETDVQEYVDSDKADSDLEIELYSRIHYLEDLGASTSTGNFQDDGICVEVSPIKGTDLFHSVKSGDGLSQHAKEAQPKLIRFVHFESSTPKDLLKNGLIAKKQTNVDKSVKLQKTEIEEGEPIASASNSKISRCSEDSGSVVICSDNDVADSDISVICIDSDDHCDSSSILLNIGGDHVQSKDMILLDSTATSDDESLDQDSNSPNPSHPEESLKFSFSATSSVSNQSGDLWHIDHEDRFSFIKKQNRYHEKRTLICNNCKKKGHLSKDCVQPRNMKCYICGRDHPWSTCHQRMCGKCLEYGHGSSKCWYRSWDIICNLCKMRGHRLTECPDLWRRYHLTTSNGVIVKGPKVVAESGKKYCYNCGNEGHYGHECLRPRMSPDSFPTWPYVISYRDPCQYLKKHLKNDSQGESSNSGRHSDFHQRHKHVKRRRSRVEELREIVSKASGKHADNSKKSRNKQKKKQFKEDKFIPLFKGNNFHGSPSIIMLGEDTHKNKKRKKRETDRLYTFKRKKQKLNATV